MFSFSKGFRLAGVSLASAIAFGTAYASDSATEVGALHAVDQAWMTAYNGGDVDGVAALYAEHARLQPPGAPAASGKAAIRNYFAKDIPASAKAGIKIVLDPNSDGGVSGNLGWVSGTFSVKDSAGHTVDTGKYLSVSKKKDGKWLYWRDTWNTDGAPAASAAATAKQ
jgi:ketosteroid isomerase-like protein